MSESQIQALLAEVQSNADLRSKLESAASLDAAEAIARDAGFAVSKAEWLAYQNQDIQELGDEQLEGVAGGFGKAASPSIKMEGESSITVSGGVSLNCTSQAAK